MCLHWNLRYTVLFFSPKMVLHAFYRPGESAPFKRWYAEKEHKKHETESSNGIPCRKRVIQLRNIVGVKIVWLRAPFGGYLAPFVWIASSCTTTSSFSDLLSRAFDGILIAYRIRTIYHPRVVGRCILCFLSAGGGISAPMLVLFMTQDCALPSIQGHDTVHLPSPASAVPLVPFAPSDWIQASAMAPTRPSACTPPHLKPKETHNRENQPSVHLLVSMCVCASLGVSVDLRGRPREVGEGGCGCICMGGCTSKVRVTHKDVRT